MIVRMRANKVTKEASVRKRPQAVGSLPATSIGAPGAGVKELDDRGLLVTEVLALGMANDDNEKRW